MPAGLIYLFILLALVLIFSARMTQGAEGGNKLSVGTAKIIQTVQKQQLSNETRRLAALVLCLMEWNTILPGGQCTPGEGEERFKEIDDFLDLLDRENVTREMVPPLRQWEIAFESYCRYFNHTCVNGTCPPCDGLICCVSPRCLRTPSDPGFCEKRYQAYVDLLPSDSDQTNPWSMKFLCLIVFFNTVMPLAGRALDASL